jgi:hypothetical protein
MVTSNHTGEVLVLSASDCPMRLKERGDCLQVSIGSWQSKVEP